MRIQPRTTLDPGTEDDSDDQRNFLIAGELRTILRICHECRTVLALKEYTKSDSRRRRFYGGST